MTARRWGAAAVATRIVGWSLAAFALTVAVIAGGAADRWIGETTINRPQT